MTAIEYVRELARIDVSGMRRRAMAVAAVAFGLAGCHGGAMTPGRNAPDSGADSTGASPWLDAAPQSDLPALEIGVGTMVDGDGADAPDPAGDLHLLLGSINDAFYGRFSACFATRRGLWPSGDFSDLPAFDDSLRLGLLVIDPMAAQSCLETLMTVACDRIPEILKGGPIGPGNVALPECAGVLVGQVPPGKTCRMSEECQDPEQYACVGDRGCGRICTARIARAMGDLCSSDRDRCPEGTTCRFGTDNKNDQRCLEPTPEGGACSEGQWCAAGLMCAERTATSIGEGTCRAFAIGSPCAGNWECPFVYVCAGAGPDHPGTCQVGKPVGATCATYLQDVNDNVYSDCAVGTDCLDLDGSGPRCTDGAPLGAACGRQSGPHPGRLGCVEGYCAWEPGNGGVVGTCQPKKPAGSACSSRIECAAPYDCLKGRDRTLRCGSWEEPAPLGSECGIGGDDCGPGEYCAVPASIDPESPVISLIGACARVIPPGQACREQLDLCEGLAECVGGVCVRCETP